MRTQKAQEEFFALFQGVMIKTQENKTLAICTVRQGRYSAFFTAASSGEARRKVIRIDLRRKRISSKEYRLIRLFKSSILGPGSACVLVTYYNLLQSASLMADLLILPRRAWSKLSGRGFEGATFIKRVFNNGCAPSSS